MTEKRGAPELARLGADARHHRDRLALYRARLHGGGRRARAGLRARTLEITFLEPGAEADSFTFG